MSSRLTPVLLSLAFHAALALLLAALRAPTVVTKAEESPRVLLRLETGALRRAPAASAQIASGSRSAPAPSPVRPTRDPESGPPEPGRPEPGRPEREVAPRPSITGLAPSRAAELSTSERVARAPPPPASRAAAARLSPEPATPAPAAPGPSSRGRATPAAPLSAPAFLPDPRALIREMERERTGGAPGGGPGSEGQATGSVESELQIRARELKVQPALPFPPALLAEGREADVTVRMRIYADGTVVPLEIVKSSGDSEVDAAAERAVRGYLFNSLDGATIEEGRVTFHFRLKRGF